MVRDGAAATLIDEKFVCDYADAIACPELHVLDEEVGHFIHRTILPKRDESNGIWISWYSSEYLLVYFHSTMSETEYGYFELIGTFCWHIFVIRAESSILS